jgi:sulfur-oxidizing protein SoxY
VAGLAGAVIAPCAVRGAAAGVDAIAPAVRQMTGGEQARPGRVKLAIPRLADNGNLVPCRIAVESPMTETNHVRRIGLFAEKNPRPVIAVFRMGPRAGKAEIVTRIRLAGTQRVVAVAELSDGSFWSDTAEVVVTVSACLDGT